ncbi:MAG: hypothetical protein ACUVRO_02655 [Armatimonadota bacterium]
MLRPAKRWLVMHGTRVSERNTMLLNWMRLRLAAEVLACVSACVFCSVVAAEPVTYGGSGRTLRVGVLVVGRQGANTSISTGAPHLFYVLDSRSDLKPEGWNLVNPMAPPRVDATVLARWNRDQTPLVPSVDSPYVAEQQITKDMAAYWEVLLSRASAEQLAEYDVLYLGGSIPALTEEERDKLRRAVDSGVTLWLETGADDAQVGRWPFGVGFPKGKTISVPDLKPMQALHPLLTQPYAVSNQELNIIPRLGGSTSLAVLERLKHSLEPTTVAGVVSGMGNNVVLASGPYGSGFVVMSGMFIGPRINALTSRGDQDFPWAGPNGPYAGHDVRRVPVPLLKLAYNIMSLALHSAQERQGPRRYGSSPEQIGAPLSRKWTFPAGPDDPTPWNPQYPNACSPAVYKGVMYVVAADAVLYAFDMEPGRDLDGDGNPDDGTFIDQRQQRPYDFGTGAPYDIIWSFDFKKEIEHPSKLVSSPVVVTVNDPIEGPVDVLYIATVDAKVYAFRALPVIPAKRVLRAEAMPYWAKPAVLGPPLSPSSDSFRVPAPVFYADRLFAVGVDKNQPSQGAVFELDPVTGEVLWTYSRSSKPMTAAAPSMGPIVASPAIAWVTDPTTGASDLVMYVPTSADVANGQTARVFCFLLSVRGERLSQAAPGDYTRFRGRHWMKPSNFPWKRFRVWVKGNPRITATADPYSPGYVKLSEPVTPDMEVYADYDIDCSSDQYKPRTTFYAFPGTQGTDYPDFLNTPVVGPDGTVYVVATSINGNKSSLYAFQERSPISFVKWRYSFPNAAVVGPLAYYNGVLYVGTGDGRLIGFDTKASFRIDIKAPIDLPRKFSVQILQRDPMLPPTYSITAFTYNASQFVIDNVADYDPSKGGAVEHGRIAVNSFSISGPSALDASQPVTVRYPVVGGPGNAEEVAEISASTQGVIGTQFGGEGDSKRANKLFDTRLELGAGGRMLAGPTIAGDTMYVATADGHIAAYPSDPRLLGITGGQLLRAATVPLAGALALPNAGEIPAPMVAAGGSLLVNTRGGVMVFHQPVTLVADSTRILEIKNSYDFSSGDNSPVPSGSRAVWSLSATTRLEAMPTPGRGVHPNQRVVMQSPEVVGFSHPSTVLRLSDTNFLVCDTGNHRVVEVNRAGEVVWELKNFADPYGILEGSEPLTLNTPTCVQRWVQPQTDRQGNVIGIEVHTLVVDAGNYRILDIRDVVPTDPRRGNQEYHVLVWASRTSSAQRRYQYQSAQRLPDGTVVATVLNYSVNSVDGSVPDGDGGSIVLLSGPLHDEQGRVVEDSNGRPVDPGGRIVGFMNGLLLPDGSERPVANPVWFQRYFTGGGATSWQALLADGYGVYQVAGELPSEPQKYPKGKVILRLLGAVQAAPTIGVSMAKQLSNGNILIVNKATSEIWEYSPVPRPGGAWFRVSPVTSGTYALSQPSSADRSY